MKRAWCLLLLATNFFLLTLQSCDLTAEDLPELPPSMIHTLTVPLGDVEIRRLYFQSGSDRLTQHDQEYLAAMFANIKTMQVYVVIKAFTDTIGDSQKNLALSHRRAQAVKDVIQLATEWPHHCFLVFGHGAKYAQTEGADEEERRVEITFLIPKKDEFNIENLRQEARIKGINLVDLGVVPAKEAPSEIASILETEPRKEEEMRSFYGTFGLVIGGGKTSKPSASFGRNALQLGLRYVINSEFHLQASYNSFLSTYKKNGPNFVTGNTMAFSLYAIQRLHRIAALIHGFGIINESLTIKKHSPDLLPDQKILKLPAHRQGFLYEIAFEFSPPKFFAFPAIGLNFQLYPNSYFIGPIFGLRF